MLKTSPSFLSFKPAKKHIATLLQLDNTLFLTSKAKKSFKILKKAFGKELVLQHFDISKPIWLEIDAFRNSIRGNLC